MSHVRQRLSCVDYASSIRALVAPLMQGVVTLFTALAAAAAAENPGLASASGVYNSSETPPTLPWNTYNFCNAPHINAAHYDLPPQPSAELLHVSVIMRHHKVGDTVYLRRKKKKN